jgi:uncharacterized protein (TIGR03435 family)
MRVLPFALLLACCIFSRAQTSQPLAFDVASVKPHRFTGEGTMGISITGGTLHAEHMSLNKLVAWAYNLEPFQLSGGPSWAADGSITSSDLFEILAKAAPGQTPTPEQFCQMMQALLADRFHLQIHRLSKPLPAYNLAVSKGGPTLKETAGGETAMDQNRVNKVGWRIIATNVTIQDAIGLLSLYAHRPIFDKTGLTGHYDFKVKWLLDPTIADAAGSDLPSLPLALQEQLGLRLESTTAPFDTVVIDHAEKPSEN